MLASILALIPPRLPEHLRQPPPPPPPPPIPDEFICNFLLALRGIHSNLSRPFGLAFPDNKVAATDTLICRDAGNNSVEFQWEPCAYWPSGFVRTAKCLIVATDFIWYEIYKTTNKSQQSSNFASPYIFTIRLTSTAGTEFIFYSGFETSASTVWMNGPLCKSFRNVVRIPPHIVGGTESVRLICDNYHYCDGTSRIHFALANDIAFEKNGGPAPPFTLSVSVGDKTAFTQTSSAFLKQYAWWTYDITFDGEIFNPVQPIVAPNMKAMVNAGLIHNYDNSIDYGAGNLTAIHNAAAPNLYTNPTQTWGLARDAGTAGGRGEIGVLTEAIARWIITGLPVCREVALGQAKAAAIRTTKLYDYELKRFVNQLDYPKFAINSETTINPVGTPRNMRLGLVAGQGIAGNSTEDITWDYAHNGSYYPILAFLEADRLLYDLMESDAIFYTLAWRDRYNGIYGANYTSWRNFPQNPETGVGWGPRPNGHQVRSFAWTLREVGRAAMLVPDDSPLRDYHRLNLRACLGPWIENLPKFLDRHGELGLPVEHTQLAKTSNYMMSFVLLVATQLLRNGWQQPGWADVVKSFWRFRLNGFYSPDFDWRYVCTGGDIYTGPQPGRLETSRFTTWKEVQDASAHLLPVPADWSSRQGGTDYQMNFLASCSMLLDYDDIMPASMIKQAADAIIKFRSEKPGPGTDPWPRIFPQHFARRAFVQTNCICAKGTTWQATNPIDLIPPRLRS